MRNVVNFPVRDFRKEVITGNNWNNVFIHAIRENFVYRLVVTPGALVHNIAWEIGIEIKVHFYIIVHNVSVKDCKVVVLYCLASVDVIKAIIWVYVSTSKARQGQEGYLIGNKNLIVSIKNKKEDLEISARRKEYEYYGTIDILVVLRDLCISRGINVW